MAAITGKNQQTLLHGPIFTGILRFALPIMLTMLLQALYQAADMIVVGWSGESNAVGAIGACGAMLNLLVNVFVGVSAGANVVVAQSIGAGDRDATERAVHTAIPVGVILGFAALVVGELACRPVLAWLGTNENVIGLSATYAAIYIAGAPVMCLTNYAAAIYRAKGDSKTPLRVLAISGLCNVVLNFFFVMAFGMNVDGVALATVLSNVISAVWLTVGLMREDGWCRLMPRKLHIYKDEFVRIMKIGIPSGIESALYALSNMLIQSSIWGLNNSLTPVNNAIQNGNAAGQSIDHFSSVVMNSFYQASVTYVGQHYGAKNYERLKRVNRMLYVVTLLAWVCFSSVVLLLRHPLISLYVHGADENALEIAKYAEIRMFWLLGAHGLLGMMNVGSGILRGMGRSSTATAISLIGSAGMRVVWLSTAFAANPNLNMLYAVYPVTWIITVLGYLPFIWYAMNKLKKEVRGQIA